MTGTSGAGQGADDLVRAHGAELHRLAAMLTADSWTATDLTARTLADGAHQAGAAGPTAPDPADRLRKDLVRRYLRSARRRVEGVDTLGDDAGDVLRRLSPRARAATALRLVERWDADRTAAALGVSRRRAEALVPRVPGLELALAGLADQHALSGAALHEALLEEMADRPATPRPGRRRWGWVAAAVVPVALLVAPGVDGREGGTAGVDEPPTEPAVTADLTEAGWRLDAKGLPPRTATGLRLRDTVALAKGRRSGLVELPDSSDLGFAAFGVLWCDMPPAEDDHLRVPAGRLTLDGLEIDLPCAGRDGSPPVSRIVALPLGGEGVLEVTGDMPGDGTAVLGVYVEQDSYAAPAPRGTRTDAPPLPGGSVALDLSRSRPSTFDGQRVLETVSVGHDSSIRVWAGRTGAVAVNVDGLPATDDGDVASMVAMFADLSVEQIEGRAPITQDPDDYAHWSTQQPDLRDGRWLVPAAGAMRTFELPEQVRPGPGARRTVVVEVLTENVEDDHLQVVLTDAAPAQVDTRPVMAVADPEAPELVLGHRLVGQWEVPSDGQLRELLLDSSAELPDEPLVMLARDLDPRSWLTWGEGVASRGGRTTPLWLQGDLDMAVDALRQPWFDPVLGGPGPLSVAAPPALGHGPATVVGYVAVPYEEFDFAAAEIPPGARPAGSSPPQDDPYGSFSGWQVQAVVGPQDLEDGRVTLPVDHGAGLAARITTEGKGRIRFLVEGNPADALYATDGWWSSWTDEAVTAELELAYSGGYTRNEIEVTIVVEDYQSFTIELLTG